MRTHKLVLANSSNIVKIMTNFFEQAFQEMSSLGLNSRALETVQVILSEAHMQALKS